MENNYGNSTVKSDEKKFDCYFGNLKVTCPAINIYGSNACLECIKAFSQKKNAFHSTR